MTPLMDQISTFIDRRLCHSLRPWWSATLLFSILAIAAGCPHEQPTAPASANTSPSATPRASVALKVLVVNDPKLAEAINRLRGEWAERSGGSLVAESRPWSDVAKLENLDADIVVFPVHYLGELVESKRLRPMRDSAIASKQYD